MKKELIRIGTKKFINESTLDQSSAFDMLFDGMYEFVYMPDYNPFAFVNGTWAGVLGHLVNGHLLVGSMCVVMTTRYTLFCCPVAPRLWNSKTIITSVPL